MGAMTSMMAPRPSCAARDLDWSAGDWWPRAMLPFLAVLDASANESIAALKRGKLNAV